MNRYLARDERTGQGSWQRTYYHQDHLGSTRALSGIESGTLTYEPFGSLVHEVGATEEHKHRFTGKPIDGTGLYYYGARFYDPELGRFISMDPARDGLNWYAYAANNPLEYIDPDGRAIKIKSGVWGDGLFPMLQSLTDDILDINSEGYVNLHHLTRRGRCKGQKPVGTTLVRKLIGHGKTIEMTRSYRNLFTPIHRSGGTVEIGTINPRLTVTGNVDTRSGTMMEMTPLISLGHELIHAWRWLSGGTLMVPDGVRGKRTEWTWKLGEEEYTRWQSREELETIGLVKPSIWRRLRMLLFVPTENAIRLEHGLDPRISYLGKEL